MGLSDKKKQNKAKIGSNWYGTKKRYGCEHLRNAFIRTRNTL